MEEQKYIATKDLEKRARFFRVAEDLKFRRSGLTSYYRLLSDYIEPTMSKFFLENYEQDGFRPSGKIIDSTATQASNILKAGMLTSITSPSRPWFKLGLQDKELENQTNVRRWLDEATDIMRASFSKTNFYEQVQVVYGTLGTFGTAALYMEEDFETVSRFLSEPPGSYYVGLNEDYKIDKYFREYSMSVRQIVNKFVYNKETKTYNWDKCSEWVKNAFERNLQEQRVNIGHIVMPNKEFDPTKKQAKFKKFISVYIEMGLVSAAPSGRTSSYAVGGADILYESGYDEFPLMCPRWATNGEDAYASNCPGFTSIGDVMQLQEGERKSLKAIDKMIDPPMVAPPSLRNQRSSLLPNDVTYLEETQVAQFRPAHAVNFNIAAMEQKQQQVRDRIMRNYYADLFLMLANSDRRNITATEIEARQQEKLLALGPVLENLNNDLLDPVIDRQFTFLERQGRLPQPPEELLNAEFKVEYISFMAQAQKAVGLNSIERVFGFTTQVAQIDPSAVKKFNTAEAIQEYADIAGAPAKIIRSDEEVEEMNAAEAQAQQQMMEMEQFEKAAKASKDLSQTEIDGDNALSKLLKQGQ